MAGRDITTTIVINARTGNGFTRVGAVLTELGSIVSGLSGATLDLLKDSTQVFRTYEKSMRDAEVALSTIYGRGTQKLRDVMDALDDSATAWAASTIFHTEDVANAIAEAAHAGWDYERIVSGLPSAMRLAQAGGLSLSDALDYIVKSTYAAGIQFDELGHFTDIWTYAANRSATTVGEVGEAMLRMGATMRFAANPEELLTLIGVMANSGYVGSEAGTLIRNSIMRLIAPTDKANAALATLGATAEEIEELGSNAELFDAYARLQEHGFRGLYDEAGQMRPILEVYSEMSAILAEMAGGADKLASNEEALSILGAIFPTRTISGALNIALAAAEGYNGLYEAMMGGAAAGYGEYAAVTMMDTLDGRTETFLSKAERLKQVFGEALAPEWGAALGLFGRGIDRIANLDEGKLDALVSGLTTIALAGGGLLGAGAALRLIGLALTPLGATALAATAGIAAVAGIANFAWGRWSDSFGRMALDTEILGQFLAENEASFRASREEIEQWNGAVDAALGRYETASETFSSKVTSAMVTGVRLSQDDYRALDALADEMLTATADALAARASGNAAYWKGLFGGDEDNPFYRELSEAAVRAAESGLDEAREAGEQLHKALFQAFSNDGTISPEELEGIQRYVQAYNQALADAMESDADRRQRAELNAKLTMAQSAGRSEAKAYAKEIMQQRDDMLRTAEEQFYTEYYYAKDADASGAALLEAEKAWNAQREALLQAPNEALLRLYYQMGGNGVNLFQLSKEAGIGTLEAALRYGDGLADYFAAIPGFFPYRRGDAWLKTETYQTAREGLSTADENLLKELVGGLSEVYDFKEINKAFGDSEQDAEFGALAGELALWRLMYGMTPEERDAYRFGPGGEMNGLAEAVAAFEGETTVAVNGDTEPLREAIEALDGTEIHVNVVGGGGAVAGLLSRAAMHFFAEGGRADEPSIFGEAGAEWAIPEEHSSRTAALLDAARAASGFSWRELLLRSGAAEGGHGGSTTTFVYSPTIHAADARGVEETLREDRERMERWWRSRQRRERLEMYA